MTTQSPDKPRHSPPFGPDQAAHVAWEYWGVRGRASALPGDRDRNFRLRGSERDYVLKFVCRDDSPSLTRAQQRVMTQIAGAESCPMVPRPVARGNNQLEAPPSPSPPEAHSSPGPPESVEALVVGTDGVEYRAVLAEWVPGIPIALAAPRDARLLRMAGEALARVDLQLQRLTEPALDRPFDWDLKRAARVVKAMVHHIDDPARRALVVRAMARFSAQEPHLDALPTQLIHGDANDYNVLVAGLGSSQRSASIGLIDFGDACYSWRVADPAIAAAYLAMNQSDPVAAMAHLVAGYHSVSPLSDMELEVVPYLVAARLCVSLCHSELRAKTEPDDAYQTISQAPGWTLLEQLSGVHPRLVTYRLRDACGMEPCPRTPALEAYLKKSVAAPILGLPLGGPVFDLSVGTQEFDGALDPTDASVWERPFADRIESEGGVMAFGRYLEPRICYQSDQFAASNDGPERQRTIHLGLDLFAPSGTPLATPYDATVVSIADNRQALDYGPTVILEHQSPHGPFWTLFGHLGRSVLTRLAEGDVILAGQSFAQLGSANENGGWPPHLHFQVFADSFDTAGNLPGVAFASEARTWASVSPDPELIVRSGRDTTFSGPGSEEMLRSRTERFAKNLSLSYREPLHIVRGIGVHLFDASGRAYLDCVNNVCHLGHAHPAVVKAASRQLSVLNTNTRYLHPNIIELGDALTATLPEGLDVCFLVNSGSEANDLAIRLAKAATGRTGILVIEDGYHGNLSSLIDVSSYKFSGPGGEGPPGYVRAVRIPDSYRHPDTTAVDFALDIRLAAGELRAAGVPAAAFIAEAILSCGGQIVPPPGYLQAAYAHARSAGAVCIADEVQTGFGRVGSAMWSFELQGVVPDIVTMGKPMGNGFPLGAVVTTRAIADAFAGGMEYFNTYGGNPVSSAVGMAVLRTIETEQLRERALRIGCNLKMRLEDIASQHPIVGDIRGEGLFLGLELVRDAQSKEPAAEEAAHLVHRMMELGVLLSTDGPRHNVIKIKPPLAFSDADVDELSRKLSSVLKESYFTETGID